MQIRCLLTKALRNKSVINPPDWDNTLQLTAGGERIAFTDFSAGMELRSLRVDPGNYWEEICDEAGDVAPNDNVVTDNDRVVSDGHMVGLASH